MSQRWVGLFFCGILSACQFSSFSTGSPPLTLASYRSPLSRSAQLDAAGKKGLAAVPGEYLVRLRPGRSLNLRNLSSAVKTARSLGSPTFPYALVKLQSEEQISLQAQITALQADPAVESLEPNGLFALPTDQFAPLPQTQAIRSTFPNDPLFTQQYAHALTQSLKGWEIQKGKTELVLAVLDTGVDTHHPDLAAKLLPGYNTVDHLPEVHDKHGHGTHCAGVAGALLNNAEGGAGFAPQVRLLPVQVFSTGGFTSFADVAEGIVWATDQGARILSMSLGSRTLTQVLEDAVVYAQQRNVLLVAGMGNDGHQRERPIKSYPAALPGVLAVGATDQADQLAFFSQVGPWHSVTAPGIQIVSSLPTYASAIPGLSYGPMSGTSMATPAVAGLAALVSSQFPQLDAAGIKAQIEATADDLGSQGFDNLYGHGRINVYRALQALAPTH
ncbi:hypothetical protein COW36_02960 [bacterium (Candidatus Blackallbacteria) CG17_big_fil_post_rev_8_21_14_2_50_48_46]|uniref:Peptidase S8/S53 domain-containing protein n=1 Tax=bacterium (Candidatus Blackallbacteria) CG17_big_fil_post_rev_8_21_14_2_50_48_46 TaxID=2014261 RepID=A0A2M7GAB5_9BACT|nr:MAG: hypothetical protein COW64_12515 [bacterium (Candidatus Blackallbacteria) CG18_big_fil_WC_8_21_14_2_50_49_26]PIW19088.1 MAG: hypothetical protein COW36_02960 [bacterium (Candidatus Blackallbacteria) CG17_big_fil_post_rev_8_21_14_2_50_48_46]PIW44545.1 MAG: hypothetical protein COW20_23160 [bacterium (Candidatus Blackallbacteria) CG13_big_fil_rev_8_21_14_2_50_49_14]